MKTLFFNGSIYSMTSKEDCYWGMIVNGDRIEELIKDAIEISELECETVDLKGQVVLPGFIDAHVHLTQTGLNNIGVSFTNVKDKKMMLDAITYNKTVMKNESIIFGTGYDEGNMINQELPTLSEVDVITGERYLWITRIDSHSCYVNTSFLKALEFDDLTAGVDKDSLGRPTGVLRDRANSIARKRALDLVSNDARKEGISIAIQKATRKGVTCIHALEGGPLFSDKDFHFISQIAKESLVRIEPHFQVMNVGVAEAYNLKRLGGCIILDGSFGSRTAAINEPYEDDPSTKGTLYLKTEDVETFVLDASSKNIQVAFHALGERAIEQILVAYEKAHKVFPNKDLRHRIEHFELPTLNQIKRAAAIGIVISVQPAFDYHWGGTDSMYKTRLGIDRTKRAIPLKSIADAGCVMVGGSDSDVTEIDPIVGIHGAANHSNPEHSISIFQAVELFTKNAAYVVGKEDSLGQLKTGMLADFVLIDQDILKISPSEIDKTLVMQTYIRGIKVFDISEK